LAAVSVPSFTAEVLRARLVNLAPGPPEQLIFFSRNGTPLTTNTSVDGSARCWRRPESKE
jgi:hypothetical protein